MCNFLVSVLKENTQRLRINLKLSENLIYAAA